jgi:hypothetical protein
MATAIKRIEKEYILNVCYTKRLSFTTLYRRDEYSLVITSLGKTELVLKPGRVLPELVSGETLSLLVDYMGMPVFCTVEVKSAKDGTIVATVPEFLYRNLERAYTRVPFPPEMKVEFACREEKFVLPFPYFEEATIGKPIPNLETGDYNTVVTHLATWVKTVADGYKLELFKDAKPAGFEKNLLCVHGKILRLVPGENAFPDADTTGRFITRELADQCAAKARISVDDFVNAKRAENAQSCVWVPLFFEKYLVGFIHVWSAEAALTDAHIETLLQYGSSVIAALTARKYFAACCIKNRFFTADGGNICPGGVLFSYSKPVLAQSFPSGKELTLRLTVGDQTINTSGRIIRYYRENKVDYWGCRFIDMTPEDTRALFEYFYGKPFTQSKNSLITGQV